MNQSIEGRLDSIEQQLKELRKEMEESIARYKVVQDGEKMPYYPFTEVNLKKLMCIKNTEIENVLGTKCPCDKCNDPVGFIPMTSQQWRDYLGKSWEEFKIKETKCLWDSIPVEDRMKPMGLSCSCRKCSAYC